MKKAFLLLPLLAALLWAASAQAAAPTEALKGTVDKVIAILREGITHASPGADDVFEPGDVVYLFGKTDKIIAITPLFSGPVRPSAKGKGSGKEQVQPAL